MSDFLKKLHNVKSFVFDVDGVLTDGTLLATEAGELLRMMNIKDGYALQLAVKKGFNVIVISGGTSGGVIKRLERLGIQHIFIGVKNKMEVWDDLCSKNIIDPSSVLYMGDDMPDFLIMQKAMLPCCPSDAVQEIKELSDYISPLAGGKGCVRDIIEKVLKVQNHWALE